MRTKEINVYTFDELSDRAKERAMNWLLDTIYDWWESTYEDAANVGLKLTGFDIDRGNYCSGEYITSAEDTATRIVKEHGESRETYKTASAYLASLATLNAKEVTEDNEDELDEEREELDQELLKELLEDYLVILRKDYGYQTSEEAARETCEANEYEFDENGKIA